MTSGKHPEPKKRSDELLPVQCKMARVAVGWGMRDLARMANVSMDTVIRLERGESMKQATIERLRITLATAGIVFDDGDVPGVRLRRQCKATSQQSNPELMSSTVSPHTLSRKDDGLPIRLQRLRANYGEKIGQQLNQSMFAALLGISAAQYGTYERGKCEPGLAFLIALRRVTGVSLDDLIAPAESNHPLSLPISR